MPNLNAKKSKLLSIKTDFRTLKYSGDQPQDGTSLQPYIRTPLAKGFEEKQPKNYFEKQGLSGVNLFAAIDKERITAFLKTNVKGKIFNGNQKQLYLSNPKTEVGTNFFYTDNAGPGILNNLFKGSQKVGGLEFTRVYNDGVNLLHQVGVQGTGYHFDEPGAQSVIPFQSKYEYVVKTKPTESNRLVLLYDNKIIDTSFRSLASTPNLAEINRVGISRNQNKLFEYTGGPNSSNSDGMTIINRYSYTTDWKDFSRFSGTSTYAPGSEKLLSLLPRPYYKKTPGVSAATQATTFNRITGIQETSNLEEVQVYLRRGKRPGETITELTAPLSFDPTNQQYSLSHKTYSTSSFAKDNNELPAINRSRVMSYDQIVKLKADPGSPPQIKEDFRIAAGDNPYTVGYESGQSMSDKNLTGDPGKVNINRLDYSVVGKSTTQYPANDVGVDLVNKLDVGEGTLETNPDLIRCVISAVETQQDSSNRVIPLTFRAFISNFADNINANYDTHQYVGRGENFYTYKNSERKVSFQLAISAQSRVEMQPLYRKVNYLISQLYAGYSGFISNQGNGFMRAPLVKLTIGDYLYDQPGFLNSMQISVPNESPWEITYDKKGKDKDMYQLPHYLLLNMNFTPIHNFVAKRSHRSDALGQTYSITPFITPNDPNNIFGIAK